MSDFTLPDQFDNYRRPKIEYEKPYGKNPVEPGASLPVRIQIEQMLSAGQRLNEYRSSQFDFDEGVEVPDDVEPDPTRNPEFDLADASRLAAVAADNLRMQAESAKNASGTDMLPANEQAETPEVK